MNGEQRVTPTLKSNPTIEYLAAELAQTRAAYDQRGMLLINEQQNRLAMEREADENREKLFKEIEGLTKRNVDLESKMPAGYAEREGLRGNDDGTMFRQLADALTECKRDNERFDKRNVALFAENSLLHDRVNGLQKEVTRLDDGRNVPLMVQRERERNGKLVGETQDKAERIRKLERLLNDTEIKASDWETRHEQLRKDCEYQLERISELENTNGKFQQQILQRSRLDEPQQGKAFADAVERLNKRIGILDRENDRFRNERDDARTKMKLIADTRKMQTELADQQRAALDKRMKQIQAQAETIGNLKRNVQRLEKMNGNLQARVDDGIKYGEDLYSKFCDSEMTVYNLSNELEDVKNERNEYRYQLDGLKAEVERLEKRCDKFLKESVQLQESNKVLQSLIDARESEREYILKIRDSLINRGIISASAVTDAEAFNSILETMARGNEAVANFQPPASIDIDPNPADDLKGFAVQKEMHAKDNRQVFINHDERVDDDDLPF